jgi:hypothetical protein
MTGTVEFVHVAGEAGGHPEARDAAEAVAGKGLRGDRYFDDAGTFSDSDREVRRDVTLIEAEALDAVESDYDITLEPGIHRRNVTVRGVPLNHLVDRRFRVGDAVLEGVELCEPCSYLERKLAAEGVREALVHRGGLRCAVIESGEVAVGAAVEYDD